MISTASRPVTPTASARAKLMRPVLIVAVVLGAIALASTLIPAATQDSRLLAINNATDSGAQAIVRVMQERGIDITAASNAGEAIAQGSRPDTTLVVIFPGRANYDVAQAIDEVPNVVYVGTEQFYGVLSPSLSPTASGSQPPIGQTVSPGPGCSSPAALNAGPVSKGAYGVSESSQWVLCYEVAPGTYSFAEYASTSMYRAVIADSRLVRNQAVAQAGNAALAINAIARTPHVVWYLADSMDLLVEPAPPTPDWLIPALLTVLVAGLTGGIARGRRLGRLVPEELPAHVPAAETVVGRGRLLRRSQDREHTARALRADTALRLARRLGVPSKAPAEQLHAALVRHGIPARRADVLLWGPTPTSDQDLVDLATQLTELEEEIRHD